MQSILQVSIVGPSFSGAVEKLFRAKMAQPPCKNWPVHLCIFWATKVYQIPTIVMIVQCAYCSSLVVTSIIIMHI